MDRPILIFGASGLLGTHLVRRLAEQGRFPVAIAHNRKAQFPVGVPAYRTPITEPEVVRKTMHRYHPAAVINCAAFTDVDGCERDPGLAARVNTLGAENIARAAKEVGARLVQLSTDYVFDGTAGPGDENARPHPINVYGKTKHDAETGVRNADPQSLVIRAASFIGKGPQDRPSFIEQMLATLRAGKPLRAAIDQIANVTDVAALAKGIQEAVEQQIAGVLHLGSRELISRYDLALLVAEVFGLDPGRVEPMMHADLGRAARRPLHGGLIVRKAEQALGWTFPSPRESLENLSGALAQT